MAVTLKDIALLSGVSRQAVSAVLNNSKNIRVSKEKRERILEIAKAENYKPNLSARHLRGIPTKMIGVLMWKHPGAMHRELFSEINRKLFEKGYKTYYVETNNAEQTEKAVADFLSRGVEGIISSYVKFDIKKSECPVPVVSISLEADEFDIYVDNVVGGYLAGHHLVEHGHKRIALLSTSVTENSRKLHGLKQALNEAGLHFNDNWIAQTGHNMECVDQIIDLIENEKVSAFFATNDYLAGKLLGVLNKLGYRVPEQIAVIGYDGMSFCEFTNPPLTTVIQPIKLLAAKTIEIMSHKIKNKILEPIEPISIEPKLFIGSSCGCKRDNLDMLYWEGTLATLEMLFDHIQPMPGK